MNTKIFILTIPSFKEVAEEIGSIVEDALDKANFFKKEEDDDFDDDMDDEPCDFTPKHLKVKEPCGNVEPWGVCGKPANEDLRFGYGLEVDEPRKQDFRNWKDFLEAREAFDDFVDSGERCVELGLDKRNDCPITKCNAIRKPIGCPPPMNVDLIGESQFPWWEKGPLYWNF